jgi:hypothetical protein
VDRFLQDLAEVGRVSGDRGRVRWLVWHDGLNEFVFKIHLWEHDPDSPALKLSHVWPVIFALDEGELRKDLEAASVVVAPVEMGPPEGFEFPFTRSVRDLSAMWRGVLAREFILKGTYPLGGGRTTTSLYVRQVAVRGYVAPNGVEQTRQGAEFIWLGNRAAEVQIYNFDAVDREVELLARTAPGPSNADKSSRTVNYEFRGRRGVVKLSEARGWQLSLPLSVKPGANSVSIWVSDPADPSLNKNGDPRDLLLNVSDARVKLRRID